MPLPSPANSLNPLPVPLKPRRSRLRTTRVHPRKKRRTSKEDPSDAPFLTLQSLSDTQVALQSLRNDWPHEAAKLLPNTPPIVLISQLHALVSDPNAIAFDIHNLCTSGFARRFKIPGGTEAFVIQSDLPTDGLPARLFSCATCDTWLNQRQLKQFDDADVTNLIRQGYLTMRDETSFWLALPGMGAFRTNREAGTKRIRRLLARAPYQEMLLVKLETRTFTDSCFTAQWHVRDFVGGGDGDCVETSVGALVRLRTTPSDNIHPQ